MTNYTKYKALLSTLNEQRGALCSKFLSDKIVPSTVFTNHCSGGVEEETVASICFNPRPWFWEQRKPTNEQVRSIQDEINRLDSVDAADPNEVFVHISHKNYSYAKPWAKIADGSGECFFTREEAQSANDLWREKFAERPDHFSCRQCGVQTPNGSAVTGEIFLYGGKRERRKFCSSLCATHNQFAQEG